MKPDIFAKNCENTSLAQTEFERTLAVYEQVVRSNPSRLRIARPIEVKDSTVYFERITGCFNLRKSICKLRVDTEILYYVGQALAELHLALNAELNSLDDNIHIHGDFSATNVLYQPSTGSVYIVDFAPYRYDRSESYSYAPAYRDLAHIVPTLEIKYPLRKIYLSARKKNKEMSAKFWAGYENVIAKKIDRNKLFAYIIDDIDLLTRYFRWKNPIYRLVWGKLFKQAKKRYIIRKEPAVCNSKSPVTDYRDSHTQPTKATVYESRLYAEHSAHTSLWHLEKEYLADLLERLVPRKSRYLDFACGTGRIIAGLADHFTKATGVDVSEPMLAMARSKKLKAKLIQADITKDADIIADNYDLITAFRFFLNAEDSLRREVVTILAEKLAPDGILVFNIHNSKPSLLWLQNSITNTFKTVKIKSMSRHDVNELLKDTPLQIVETTAFGIIPKAAHIILRARLWRRLDRTLRKCRFLQNIGSDMIYVCRRQEKDGLF